MSSPSSSDSVPTREYASNGTQKVLSWLFGISLVAFIFCVLGLSFALTAKDSSFTCHYKAIGGSTATTLVNEKIGSLSARNFCIAAFAFFGAFWVGSLILIKAAC